MADKAPEQQRQGGHADTDPDLNFLISTMMELRKSEDVDLVYRCDMAEFRCRKLFEYYAMKLCGLYEASVFETQAELNVERCLILQAVCGHLQTTFQAMKPVPGVVEFIEGLGRYCRRFVDTSEPNLEHKTSKTTLIQYWEVEKLRKILTALPVSALVFVANLRKAIFQSHIKLHLEERSFRFDKEDQSLKGSHRKLRMTIERLHINGQGGRLSMISTVLLLVRLASCIKKNVTLSTTTTTLLPPLLFRLQEYGPTSSFNFDQGEIMALLEICESTAKGIEPEEDLKPFRFEMPTLTSLRKPKPNLTHELIGTALHTHYWMEEVLEMLEDGLWKDLDAPQKASKRASFIQAASVYDALPKWNFLAAFGLKLQLDEQGKFDSTGRKCPEENVERSTEEGFPLGYATIAAKISIESSVAMGKGNSLLTCMRQGLDTMSKTLHECMDQCQRDVYIKLLLEDDLKKMATSHSQEIERNKLSLQAERCESQMALQNLKETLKNAREENKKLRLRQEKEGEAIFDSLNLKISERDAELDAATSRIRDLERELRKTETQGAKEIKKEQAKKVAAEEAHDKIRAELMTTKADLEAVEASRATLETKLETFKEKQMEFVQKGEKVKKELDELKIAYSTARATPEINDAMIAKAFREAEDAKEREFAERMAVNYRTREVDLKIKTEEMRMKDTQLKSKDDELVRKGEELMVMESLLQDKDRSLAAAGERYAILQSTVRDYFTKERELADRRDDLKSMLE